MSTLRQEVRDRFKRHVTFRYWRIIDIFVVIRRESRPPQLHSILILQTVSLHCISAATPLHRIWWRRSYQPTGPSNYSAGRLSWSSNETFVWSSLSWNNSEPTKRGKNKRRRRLWRRSEGRVAMKTEEEFHARWKKYGTFVSGGGEKGRSKKAGEETKHRLLMRIKDVKNQTAKTGEELSYKTSWFKTKLCLSTSNDLWPMDRWRDGWLLSAEKHSLSFLSQNTL